MSQFLSELEETDDPAALSVYLPPGLTLLEAEDTLVKAGLLSPASEIVQTVAASGNGAVLFWGSQRRCLVLPPFPLAEKLIFPGLNTEPLRILVNTDFRIGLILVHLGSYAIGLCQGDKLISSKVGTGLVHGRHKKGGSSQQRFQRRRDKQVQEFLDRVCRHVRELLEQHAQQIDYVLYGGPRQTVLLLQKRCPILESLTDRSLPLLNVPSLGQKVLETTVDRIWSSSITQWQEE